MNKLVEEETVQKDQAEEEEFEVEEEIEEEKENDEEKENEEEKEIEEEKEKEEEEPKAINIQRKDSNESKSANSEKEEKSLEEPEVEGEGICEIKMAEEDENDDRRNENDDRRNENENELRKNNYDIQISPELKINVESLYDEKQGETNVLFATDSKEKLVLHWGVYTDAQNDKWYHPDFSCYPQNTVEFDDFALQTDFAYLDEGDDEQKIRMRIPKDKGVNTLNFVFFEKNKNIWHNNDMKDYHLNLN